MNRLFERLHVLLSLLTVLIVAFLYSSSMSIAKIQPVLKQSSELKTPTWSPDETRIAVTSQQSSEQTNILQFNLANKNKKTLVALEGTSSQPVFSYSGDTLYFFHRPKNAQGEIWTIDKNGNKAPYIHEENFGGWVESPAPHPLTEQLAFFGRKQGIFGVWRETGQDQFTPIGNENTFQISPKWGPNGQYLYYLEKSQSMNVVKYMISTQEKSTVLSKDFMLAPDIHPLTNELIYTTNKADNLKIMALDQDGTKRVITSATRKNSAPAISPSGTKLAFISNQFKAGELWIMDYPKPNGHYPHTIRINRPRPLQRIQSGFQITGVATGTIRVDGQTKLREAETVSIFWKTDSDSILLNREQHGISGVLASVSGDDLPQSESPSIVIHVSDQKGRTTREIPLNNKQRSEVDVTKQ